MKLLRADYTQVGPCSGRSMVVLDGGKKESSDHVAVGDNSGQIQCFYMKRGAVKKDFVIKAEGGTPVTHVSSGRNAKGLRDRIFYSHASTVHGISKKGKEFFSMDTNLVEDISSIHVAGTSLHMAGELTVNHFKDNKEVAYYRAPDKINEMLCLQVVEDAPAYSMLACEDRVVRAVTDSEVIFEEFVDSAPKAMTDFGSLRGKECPSRSFKQFVVGMASGDILQCHFNRTGASKGWKIESDEYNQSAVTSLLVHDLDGDGVENLIAGRDNGTLNVYGFYEEDEPYLAFSEEIGECVMAMDVGQVLTPGSDEIVASTFTGKVVGLTTEHASRAATVVEEVRTHDVVKSKESSFTVQKIEAMKDEILELQTELKKAPIPKNKVLKSTDTEDDNANNYVTVSNVPVPALRHSAQLDPKNATYSISIECERPIEMVILRADVPVDLVDNHVKENSIFSRSPPDLEQGSHVLATYRCSHNQTRLNVIVRTIEGSYGAIECLVIVNQIPKRAIKCAVPVKPLSLHRRIHEDCGKRPMSKLTVNGKFSSRDMHEWVRFCLPEVPLEPPQGSEISYCFESTFLGTQLEIEYGDGVAEFKSDSVSTISILKDVVTKRATNLSMKVDIHFSLNDESVPYVLELLHPKLDKQLMLAKKVQLIESLKELEIQEGNMKFMSNEYMEIMNNAQEIKKDFEAQPRHLERLFGMITDLYIDYHKFKGINVKSNIGQLVELLENYNLETLTEFFMETNGEGGYSDRLD